MAQLKRSDFIGVADAAGDQEIGPNWSGMVPQGLKRAVAGIGEYGSRVAAMPVYAAKDVANKGANAILGIGDSIVGATTGRRFNPPQFDTGSTVRNIAAMGQLQGEAMDALGAQPVAAATTPATQTAFKPIGSSTPSTTPTPTAAANAAPPIAASPSTARTVIASNAATVPDIGTTGPSAIVKGTLDQAAATALHDRVDFSHGSKNAQNIAADAKYRDEVAKAVRINAANGMAPDASQIREIGMSDADVTKLLAANNRNGQFDKTIAGRLAQQKTDADTTVANANNVTAETGRIRGIAEIGKTNAETNTINAALPFVPDIQKSIVQKNVDEGVAKLASAGNKAKTFDRQKALEDNLRTTKGDPMEAATLTQQQEYLASGIGHIVQPQRMIINSETGEAVPHTLQGVINRNNVQQFNSLMDQWNNEVKTYNQNRPSSFLGIGKDNVNAAYDAHVKKRTNIINALRSLGVTVKPEQSQQVQG